MLRSTQTAVCIMHVYVCMYVCAREEQGQRREDSLQQTVEAQEGEARTMEGNHAKVGIASYSMRQAHLSYEVSSYHPIIPFSPLTLNISK
jgi:hypothetical protein